MWYSRRLPGKMAHLPAEGVRFLKTRCNITSFLSIKRVRSHSKDEKSYFVASFA